jgi:SpoIID/LytB domain protein
MIRIVLALFLIPLVGGSFGHTAAAAGSFTFYGGGYGHGVGMSQYGALGMAQDGWTYQEILTQFYSDTAVGQYVFPPSIRVGLVQGAKVFHLHARGGSVELHVGGTDGRLAGVIPSGATWEMLTESGHYRLLDGRRLVGGHEWGGRTKNLIATYQAGGAMLQIQESGGTSYNRGRIEFNIYGDNSAGRAIAILNPQDYLYGLSEVPSDWPAQALQAQAVAARTYAFEIAKRKGQHQSWCNCAVSDDTRSQVYLAWDKEGVTDGNRWVAAVDKTAGEAVLYGGALIQAHYASSDGGYSEDVENVWNGTALPYLRGVCDPGDFTTDNPNRVWQKTVTAAAATSALVGYTGNIGTITSFADYQRGVSGRIMSVAAVGTSGRHSVTGAQLKAALGLLDDRVWIDSDLTVTGPIRSKYDAVGCQPGLPQAQQADVAGGTRQEFADGTIYFRGNVGAHWIHGRVLDYYLAQRGPGGGLGFPTSDVEAGSDGRTWATFQNGKIACPAGAGVCSLV